MGLREKLEDTKIKVKQEYGLVPVDRKLTEFRSTLKKGGSVERPEHLEDGYHMGKNIVINTVIEEKSNDKIMLLTKK